MIAASTRLKMSAHQKPSTWNPGTSMLVSKMSSALIIRVNNPSVRIVIGRVRTKSKGLIVTLIIPRTKATIRAVVKSAT